MKPTRDLRIPADVADAIGADQNDTQRAVEAISRISDVISAVNEHQATIATTVEEQSATTPSFHGRRPTARRRPVPVLTATKASPTGWFRAGTDSQSRAVRCGDG